MAREKVISYAKFQEQFSSENVCREYLFKSRWKDSFVCLKCGCKKYNFLAKRNLNQCCDCRHQQSLTAGSVMHGSHLPLTAWFWAIFLIARDKRGYSAAMLSRELAVRTAILFLQLSSLYKSALVARLFILGILSI